MPCIFKKQLAALSSCWWLLTKQSEMMSSWQCALDTMAALGKGNFMSWSSWGKKQNGSSARRVLRGFVPVATYDPDCPNNWYTDRTRLQYNLSITIFSPWSNVGETFKPRSSQDSLFQIKKRSCPPLNQILLEVNYFTSASDVAQK
jgi:hypothetical protein